MKEGAIVGAVKDVERQIQGATQAAIKVHDEHTAHVLVVEIGDEVVLERMREWAVADVVKQCGRERRRGLVLADGSALLGEIREGILHQSHGSQRVSEAGMLGSGKDEVPDAQLPNSPKALHLWGLNEVQDEVLRDGDEPVNRIGEYFESAGHFALK